MNTEETVEITREVAVGMLAAYVDARLRVKNETFTQDKLGQLIKHYLETHEEVLYDGEHEIEARLQERGAAPVYDLVSIQDKDPVLFGRLMQLGCLTVNAAAVKAQGQQLLGIERYAGPGKGTTALIVQEKRG